MKHCPNPISAQEFSTLLQTTGTIAILDVRTKAEVNSQYLENCYHLPLAEVTALSAQTYLDQQAYDSKQTIYLLCATGMRAGKAAEKLAASLKNPIRIIDGGIQALEQAGAPLKQGSSTVISLERQVRIGAGSLIMLGVALGWLIHPAAYSLAAAVGAGLFFAGVSNTCAMAMVLTHAPWNKAG